jgi:hypothetical protein
VTVRDTGVGIPAEELPRLFERFRQVPGRRARTHEGSGIGLALVHELVRLHGGAVAVESAVGVGTTFRVTVPFGVAHLPADQLAEAEPEDWHSPDDAAATAASSGVSTAGVSTTAAAFADEAALWTAGAGPEAPAGRAPGDGAAGRARAAGGRQRRHARVRRPAARRARLGGDHRGRRRRGGSRPRGATRRTSCSPT